MKHKLLIILSVLFLQFHTIFALDSYTMDVCSLDIIVEYVDKEDITPISGVTLEVIQVASLNKDNSYSLLKDFKSTHISFDNMTVSQSRKYASQLSKMQDKVHASSHTKTTDNQGKISLTKLQSGIYLIRQKNATGDAKNYTDIEEYLCLVPQAEGDKWIKNVKSQPKMSIKKKNTPKKKKRKKTDTSDDTNMYEYIGLALISVSIIGILLLKKRKAR